MNKCLLQGKIKRKKFLIKLVSQYTNGRVRLFFKK